MERSKIVILCLVTLLTGCVNTAYEAHDHEKMVKVENMMEIQNVISAYAMAWDKENTGEFANHFTEEAIIIDSWHKVETERFNGVQEFMDARQSENGNVGGHSLSLVHFKKLDDKSASTEVVFNYFWYGNYITSDATVNIRGSYIDEWVKTDSGWRIEKRIIEHENVPSHRAEQLGLTK